MPDTVYDGYGSYFAPIPTDEQEEGGGDEDEEEEG
jgi:hypothetical protein